MDQTQSQIESRSQFFARVRAIHRRWPGLVLASIFSACAHDPGISEGPRDPAALSAPVNLVCAGPATSDHVFMFSAQPGRLVRFVKPRSDGTRQVNGQVDVRLRGRQDQVDYEGPVTMTGFETSDRRQIVLEGSIRGSRLRLSMSRRGPGQAELRLLTGTQFADTRKYSARCQPME